MSQPNPYDASSYPSVILAPTARRARQPTTPSPTKKESLPWARIAIGSAIAWQAAIVVMALYIVMTSGNEPIKINEEPIGIAPPRQVAQEPKAAPKAEVVLPEPEERFLQKEDFVDCAQIGTDVLFMKTPTEAFKRARAEKKMVFMVHLSGNLEDKEFT